MQLETKMAHSLCFKLQNVSHRWSHRSKRSQVAMSSGSRLGRAGIRQAAVLHFAYTEPISGSKFDCSLGWLSIHGGGSRRVVKPTIGTTPSDTCEESLDLIAIHHRQGGVQSGHTHVQLGRGACCSGGIIIFAITATALQGAPHEDCHQNTPIEHGPGEHCHGRPMRGRMRARQLL